MSGINLPHSKWDDIFDYHLGKIFIGAVLTLMAIGFSIRHFIWPLIFGGC